MPYINKERRTAIEYPNLEFCRDAGELNYKISTIIKRYWQFKSEPSYQTINDILGALEGAKLEFYRRVAVPYEEQKIKENGDIY